MEYMGDEKYWDEKFSKRNDAPIAPEKALVNSIKWFKPGTVLDIACGDGRNSLFLLENGFKVTGIDFSNEALQRLVEFSKRIDKQIITKQIDLSKPKALSNVGLYDNVVISHYRVDREQLHELVNHINENGILFVTGFGHNHVPDSKIRKEDLLEPSDFEMLADLFELVEYSENEDDRGFFVNYIYRRNSK